MSGQSQFSRWGAVAMATLALQASCGGPLAEEEPVAAGVQAKPGAESGEGKAALAFTELSKKLEGLPPDTPVDPDWLAGELEAVLEIDDEHPGARYNLAVLAVRRGEHAKAREVYEDLYDDDEDFAPAAENVAAEYVDKGDSDDAVDIYNRLVKRDPKNVTSRLGLARILLRSKKYDDAIKLCRQALQEQADAIEAFRVLARAYIAKGNTAMAQLIIGKGLKVDEDDVELHTLTAQILLAEDELADGVNKLKDVVRRDPENLKVRAELADIALKYRDFGNAAQQYEKITQEDPGQLGGWIGLGVSYKGLGRYEQAEKIYKQILTSNANEAATLWNLAVLYHRHLNRYNEAISTYQQFAKSAPPENDRVKRVDKLVAQISKLKKDLKAQKEREERERRKREAIEAACEAVAQGRPPKAEAIGNDQQRVETAWQLLVDGQAVAGSGDVPGADRLAACAFGILPTSKGANAEACAPMRVFWAAQVLYPLGRLQEALSCVRAGLKCDANNPEAQLIEQQLLEFIAQQEAAEAATPEADPAGGTP